MLVFHDDALYFLAPIQRADYDADDDANDTLTEQKRQAWCYSVVM